MRPLIGSNCSGAPELRLKVEGQQFAGDDPSTYTEVIARLCAVLVQPYQGVMLWPAFA
jgi:hypothetical protein